MGIPRDGSPLDKVSSYTKHVGSMSERLDDHYGNIPIGASKRKLLAISARRAQQPGTPSKTVGALLSSFRNRIKSSTIRSCDEREGS